MKREELMIDDIISIVEKSRINKMAKYVIYDYLNNHIKKALTQPIITNEQVKEEIGFLHDYASKQANGGFLGIAVDEYQNNITQYIAQLEKLNKGHQEIIELLTQERDTAFDKLDKIEEWARNTHMDDISRKMLFKIIKEMENPND